MGYLINNLPSFEDYAKAEFNPDLHPRDSKGRFASTGSSGTSEKDAQSVFNSIAEAAKEGKEGFLSPRMKFELKTLGIIAGGITLGIALHNLNMLRPIKLTTDPSKLAKHIFENKEAANHFEKAFEGYSKLSRRDLIDIFKQSKNGKEFTKIIQEWGGSTLWPEGVLLKHTVKTLEGSAAGIKVRGETIGSVLQRATPRNFSSGSPWLYHNPKAYAELRALTQAFIQKHYTGPLTLYRGVNGAKYVEAIKAAKAAGQTHITLSEDVLTSYSSSKPVSNVFAQYGIAGSMKDQQGVVFKRTVPLSDVVLAPVHGSPEMRLVREFVIKSTNKTVTIPLEDVTVLEKTGPLSTIGHISRMITS
jgi:hypothetical protein